MDARKQHKSGGSCTVRARISTPSGGTTEAYVTDAGDGTYRVEYTAYEDGETMLTLTAYDLKLCFYDSYLQNKSNNRCDEHYFCFCLFTFVCFKKVIMF